MTRRDRWSRADSISGQQPAGGLSPWRERCYLGGCEARRAPDCACARPNPYSERSRRSPARSAGARRSGHEGGVLRNAAPDLDQALPDGLQRPSQPQPRSRRAAPVRLPRRHGDRALPEHGQRRRNERRSRSGPQSSSAARPRSPAGSRARSARTSIASGRSLRPRPRSGASRRARCRAVRSLRSRTRSPPPAAVRRPLSRSCSSRSGRASRS